MRRVLILGLLAGLLAAPGAEGQRRKDYCATCERDKRGKIKRSAKVLRDFQRAYPCPATGKKTGKCPGWAKNHRVPLACGGKDAVSNLEWLTLAEKRKRDAIERKGCGAGSL